MRNPRIKIRKKEAEWEKLKIVLSSFQYQTDFKKFIALKARHLVAQYKKDPASIIKLIAGETRQELIPLDGETYRSLREISKLSNKPIACIIDDFYISPMIQPPSPEGFNLR